MGIYPVDLHEDAEQNLEQEIVEEDRVQYGQQVEHVLVAHGPALFDPKAGPVYDALRRTQHELVAAREQIRQVQAAADRILDSYQDLARRQEKTRAALARLLAEQYE